MSSKKTTTQNSTTTMTPTNPEWVTNAVQSQMGRLAALGASDPYQYVAPASGLQQQGFEQASRIGGQAGQWIGAGADRMQALANWSPGEVATAGVDPRQAFAAMGAADPSTSLARLLSGAVDNPYLGQMHQASVNRAMQGYDDALQSGVQALVRSALPGVRSGGLMAGQYGGSRQGIAEGMAMGDFAAQMARNARNLGQSAMDSGAELYGGAYDRAQDRMSTTANSMAGLAIQNAQQNASNALQAQQANQSARLAGANLNLEATQQLANQGQYGLNALNQFGGVQRDIANQSAQAPLTLNQALSGMYGQLPLNLFNGRNETGNSKTTEKTSGLGYAVPIFSDLLKSLTPVPMS